MTSIRPGQWSRTVSEPHVSRTIPEVQVAARWTPPSGTLGELVAASRLRAARLEPVRRDLEDVARRAAVPPSFATSLRGSRIAVIAEVKRRSPSRGDINPGLDAADQALAYADGGAAAISVLTEPDRFNGRPEDLTAVRARVDLPVLRKDFLIDPLQLVEARALGASAALVIVRAVDPVCLGELVDAARVLGLDLLVEIHTEGEADRALATGARVIGVNNRDLETLAVDPTRAHRLIPQLPPDVVAVAESGIVTRADVEAAAAVGADAVLVGTALSAASDPTALVRALGAVPRRLTGRH
jgi:indole-3-glycerol phosphate synthase